MITAALTPAFTPRSSFRRVPCRLSPPSPPLSPSVPFPCQRCGCFTSVDRLAKLAAACVPVAEPRKSESWRLLGKGLHPKRSGVAVDLQLLLHLGGVFGCGRQEVSCQTWTRLRRPEQEEEEL